MKNDNGVGLLAAILLLTIFALGIGLTAPVLFQVIASDNTTKTQEDLEQLKIALAGNPRLIISSGRADYGFIGTMGSVPSSVNKLWLQGTQPTYTFDTVKKVGAGWVGPYVPGAFAEDLIAMENDRFGNAYIYTSTPFVRSSDSQTVAVRIQSAGLDGTANTSDDVIQDILSAEIYSTVTGTLYKGSQTVPYATVTLNIPSNGTVSQQTTTTNASGVFTFSNVTFGFRSVSIDPKLTYEPNSAGTQGGQANTVKFTVTNYAPADVTITTLTATHNKTAWYEKIRVGNTDVFDWNNGTRAASGQTVNFSSSVVIGGSGKPSQVVPIRVDKETTVTPDVLIRGVGKSVVIQLQDFKNASTGSASTVSMSGASFTVGFSDGSQNTFTVP